MRTCSTLLVAGSTLIELMVTLSALAILMSLALTSFSFIDLIATRSELETLHAACRYTQIMAQVTNKVQELTFDQQNMQYHFCGRTKKLARSVVFGTKPGVKGPPSAPTESIYSPITFQKKCMRCTPQGIIQPGTVYLSDSGKRCQYALSAPIAQVSCLRCYRHDGAWRLL